MMYRFTAQLFGVTIFVIALIWIAGPGDANQLFAETPEPILWADTVHINTGHEATETTPKENVHTGSRDTFLSNIKKLTQTAFFIRNQYMEDVNVEEIIDAGIRGMLSDLDRYSVLMEQEAYEGLMETTHGKYEGLGMHIDQRDGRVIIVSPIEGTPAYRKGLRAGDIIWEINGESTEGMSSADAADRMRGDAGTSVTLTIKRPGMKDLLEYDIDRAVIELKSVNYYGTIPETDIGYIRLSRFAEETSRELREAVSKLNDQNVSGLIFDLRSNGGGLLDQAKETAELFLDEGQEIVFTKGRDDYSVRHYISERPPLLSPDKPLVVLVDGGTASASEIVSGAIQDWDRGVIIGSTTYGKGLVQQIFQISNDQSSALKLTTAKYYVPSGRCIQRPDRQGKTPPDHPVDLEENDDSLVVSDRDVYYTNRGRVVYGGGGIVPDLEIEPEHWKPIEINLERKSLFFDYAITYVADHPDITKDFEVTDDIVNDFKDFIKEKDFTYTSVLQAALDDLKETITDEEQESVFKPSLDEMEKLVQEEKDDDFDESLPYIKKAIKREIVRSVYGERGNYEEIVLKDDKVVRKAVEILTNPNEYTQIITEGQKKAEL